MIRDYLRRLHDVYVSQAAHVAGTPDGAPAVAAVVGAEPGAPEVWAPLGDVTAGRLAFTRGAAKVVVRGDAAEGELYRARFQGPHSGGARGRRDHHRHAEAPLPPLRLARPILRRLAQRRRCPGRCPCAAACGSCAPTSAVCGSSRSRSPAGPATLRSGCPSRPAPCRCASPEGRARSASTGPATAALRAVLSGGASRLEFGDQRLGAVGGHNVLSTPGFDEATDRYEVRFSGGASQVTVDVA